MGEDNKIFSSDCVLMMGNDVANLKPIGKVVESSVSFESDYEFSYPKPSSYSFGIKCDKEDLSSILGVTDSINELSNTYSLMIGSEPKINKPKNLKYSNKKRARRIWKKWAKRFGFTPSEGVFFPNVKISSEFNPLSGITYNVTAMPIEND